MDVDQELLTIVYADLIENAGEMMWPVLSEIHAGRRWFCSRVLGRPIRYSLVCAQSTHRATQTAEGSGRFFSALYLNGFCIQFDSPGTETSAKK